MKGTNEFRFNEATMIEAMQEYLDKRTVGIAPRVQSVKVIHETAMTQFQICVAETEPEPTP